MSQFAITSESYEICARGQIYVVHAHDPLVTEVARADQTLRRMLDPEDATLQRVAELSRFARFRSISSVLPYTHPALGLTLLCQELDRECSILPPSTPGFEHARRALRAIGALLDSGENTLGTQVVELLADEDPHARLLAIRRGGRLVEATETFLHEMGVPTRVAEGSALASEHFVQTLVCVGPAAFFPSASWTAPRAESTCFVNYGLSWSEPQPGGLFGEEGGLHTPTFRQSGEVERDVLIERVVADDALALAASRIARRTSPTPHEAVEAVLLVLADGYAVWTEADDRNWMLCVDADAPLHPVIRRKPQRSIGEGDFIVLRDGEADSDFIRALADARCGSAPHRPAQEHWKAHLRQAVAAEGGISAAEGQLARLGAVSANLRYWIGPKCIHPQTLQDFTAVCTFSGLTAQTGQLWGAMGEIRRAHLRAGQLIRKELEDRLLEEGAETLVRIGIQRYEVEALGHLTAFRFLYRHPAPAFVSATLIDKPFVAEEAGWPG